MPVDFGIWFFATIYLIAVIKNTKFDDPAIYIYIYIYIYG